MALVTTITEIKTIHPRLVSSVSKEAWMPNFLAAEYKYLVPLVGADLYDDIQTKYTGATLAGDEITLHKKMQAVIIAAAYMDEAPRNVALITDNGLRSANTNDMQRVFGWEYKEFKQGLADLYYDSVEVLLNWLYDNQGSFSLWTGDASYTQFAELFIKNGTEFNNFFRLYQPMRSYWTLRGIVRDVQDKYIRKNLGIDLLEYLRDVTSPGAAETEIITGIKRAIAFLTVYRACRQYSVRFSDQGFTITTADVQANSSTSAQPGNDLLQHHMRSAETDGLAELADVKKLCYDLYTDASVSAFNTAYAAGPLADYVDPTTVDKNQNLTSGFRFGV